MFLTNNSPESLCFN